jgi:trans-o-hydroxybenzylidenepyruvate hydratase-aldolase
MISCDEIRGLYAIIPTPAKPGAQRLDATDTVDVDETRRLVEGLIRDGAQGLITTGTTGECATLSESDFRTFAACVLEVTADRIPVFIGATSLSGHTLAHRLRFLRERGAAGTLLGLPMWQPLTVEMAVDHYRQISELFPELAVMVYANTRAFRFGFPLEFWSLVVAQAPTVVAAKYSRPKSLVDLLPITQGRVNVIPNEMTAADFYKTSPETTTAVWGTAAAMGPEPMVALMRAIQARDGERIGTVSADLVWAGEPVRPYFRDPDIFASYNLQLEKARINAAGYCNCGPCRPPYDHLPEEYREAARQCGERWRELRERYGQSVAAPAPAAIGGR